MKSCCENKASELEALRVSQLGVLKAVLAINAVMFIIEIVSGLLSHSTALSADSLDMLGDATVYAFSIYALHKSAEWKTKAAKLKAAIMVLFGLSVLGGAIYRAITGAHPLAEAMGVVGFVALCANTTCLYLLWKHKSDDINMRSTWICSRNDIVSNIGVVLASGLVALTKSGWPDIAIGGIIALIFLASAVGIIKDADELAVA